MLKNKTMHLCNTCNSEFPTCKGKEMEFGSGKGNDNVIACDCYSSTRGEMFHTCPNCLSTTFITHEFGKQQCCRCGEIY